MALDDIVNVTITRETTTPTVQSFNDILIAAEFLASSITPAFGTDERVRAYSSLQEIEDAGYSTTETVYLAAQAIFAQNPKVNQVKVGRKLTGVDGTETWTEALGAINEDDSDWYGLVVGTRTLADQQLAADWTESNDKLLGLSSDDSNIISGTGDIAEYVQTNALARTFVIYHPNSDLTATDEYPDAAWLGNRFPYDPGTTTWKFKTLSGVSVYSLTTTERNTALGKNCNIYTTVAGVNITEEGIVGEGEFLDVIRGVDALKADIQTEIYTLLVREQKVPYTDGGVKSIESILQRVLQTYVDNGFLADYVTSAPRVADVSSTDRGNRLLPDVNFESTLASAIHAVEVNGVVSL